MTFNLSMQVARARLLSFTACNFLLAWPAFNVPSMLWKTVGVSPCYPVGVPPVVPTAYGYTAILGTMAALVTLVLVVASLVKTEPVRLCRSRVLALTWSTVVATFPIMLGWAVKDLYLQYIVSPRVPFLSFLIFFSVVCARAMPARSRVRLALHTKNTPPTETAHKHTRTHIYLPISISISIYPYMYLSIYVCIYIYISIYTYIYR